MNYNIQWNNVGYFHCKVEGQVKISDIIMINREILKKGKGTSIYTLLDFSESFVDISISFFIDELSSISTDVQDELSKGIKIVTAQVPGKRNTRVIMELYNKMYKPYSQSRISQIFENVKEAEIWLVDKINSNI